MILLTDTQKNIIKEVLEWILCIIIAVVIAILIRYFIGTPTVVKQSSMFPTLKNDERLWLNRWARTTNFKPERGDIVTFEAPSELSHVSKDEANANDDPVAKYDNEPEGIFSKFTYYVLETKDYKTKKIKQSFIKRVIGLPKEHVEIKSGKVYIDGKELEEPYLQDNVYTGDTDGAFTDIVVPEGYVFVMGDNRSQSTDSRKFGCVPIDKIESKVLFRYWPFNKFGKVE